MTAATFLTIYIELLFEVEDWIGGVDSIELQRDSRVAYPFLPYSQLAFYSPEVLLEEETTKYLLVSVLISYLYNHYFHKIELLLIKKTIL